MDLPWWAAAFIFIVEAWLGKTQKTQASSTIEAVFMLLKKLFQRKE